MNTSENSYANCHRTTGRSKNGYGSKAANLDTDRYGDGDVPEVDIKPHYRDVEPLPESSRPRRDGPGGN